MTQLPSEKSAQSSNGEEDKTFGKHRKRRKSFKWKVTFKRKCLVVWIVRRSTFEKSQFQPLHLLWHCSQIEPKHQLKWTVHKCVNIKPAQPPWLFRESQGRASRTDWRWSSLQINFWLSRGCERVLLTIEENVKPHSGEGSDDSPFRASHIHSESGNLPFCQKEEDGKVVLVGVPCREPMTLWVPPGLNATAPAAGQSNYCCNRCLICVCSSFTGRLALFTQPDRFKDL